MQYAMRKLHVIVKKLDEPKWISVQQLSKTLIMSKESQTRNRRKKAEHAARGIEMRIRWKRESSLKANPSISRKCH